MWMPGMPTPRLLPAFPRRALTIQHVNGHTLIGLGELCRVYVLAHMHREPSHSEVLCLIHDRPHGGFFWIPRTAYRIG